MQFDLAQAQKFIQAQPFSVFLGASVTGLSQGYAELSLPNQADFKQNFGFVHGGVISYLADNTITFAAATVLGECVTSEYKLNYVKPAIGDSLVARSTVLSAGRSQAVCECKVYTMTDSQEKLVAVAQGTIVSVNFSKTE